MSLVARSLEAAGIPTVCVTSALDIVEAGKPPRSGFVDYPLGHSCGKPFDLDDQLAIVKATLRLLEMASVPGQVVDLGRVWSPPDWRSGTLNASSGDTRETRDTTPQYQFEADRVAAQANT